MKNGALSGLVPSTAPALTKAEYAYREIRARLLDGRLIPGTLLSSESIAAELGLSTTPIREAMRRLASDNLITLSAHRDVRINPLSLAEMEQLYGVRQVLDPAAAAMACTAATDDQLVVPRKILDATGSGGGSLQEMHSNRDFHRAIYGSCGSDVLIAILESLWDRSDRYRLLLIESSHKGRSHSRHAIHSEHVAIADAFEARDAKAISELISAHLAESRDGLLRHFGPA